MNGIRKQKQRSKYLRPILRILLIGLAVFLVLFASLFLYLTIKKNDISKDLLTSVNKELKGDFSVESVSLGSLLDYPNLKLVLRGLRFHAPSGPKTNGEMILNVDYANIKTDLSQILTKQIELESLIIKKAQLIIERDSFGQAVISEGFEPINRKKEVADSVNLTIDIKNILIDDLQVLVLDHPTGLELPFNVTKLKGTFQLKNNYINGLANIDLDSIHFEETKALFVNELPILISTNYSVDIDNDFVQVKGNKLFFGPEPYEFNYEYDFSDSPSMDLQLSSLDQGVNLATLFVEKVDTIQDNESISLLGEGHFKTLLHWDPNSRDSFFEALEAEFAIEGKKLTIYGMDLDDVINKFKRSQEFNFADVGAVMFAGPAGLAVTKGTDFARLAFTQAGDSTHVRHFLAEWHLENGILATEDVALSTNTNLVATNGWYNVKSDSLDFNISILDKRGCDLVGQRIYGEALHPEYGKVKLLKTFFGPVTNFFRNIGIAKCDTVYSGRVAYPKK